ncbi:MAG TPA: TetR/AcrR family transcriptional regulator [Acidimicrobiia bacterium]|nr:TetR/AcrR family transcriptional regulator [Acidimicrobiia bacterium]
MSQVMNLSGDELSPKATQILDAALTCISRVGLAKTTLDDVAREAGCARATVYRCFSNKQQMLSALVAREAVALSDSVVVESALSEALGDAIATVVCESVRFLGSHPALTFVCTHEPEVLLPYLAFEREDAVLRTAAALVAPAFTRFLEAADAVRLGEWVARITLSYLFSPSEQFDLADKRHVRALVDDFVVPGFVKSEGVSR